MTTLIGVLDNIYDVLITVAEDDVGIPASESQKHVDALDRTEDIATPFFGFEWQRNPNDIGFGSNRRVTGIGYDTDGDIADVETASDYELIVDIGALVDGDKPRQRDQYLQYVDAAMRPFEHDPCSLGDGINDVEDQGAVPSDLGTNADVGVRTTWRIEYEQTATEDATPVKSVDWNVDVGGVDAYPEEYN